MSRNWLSKMDHNHHHQNTGNSPNIEDDNEYYDDDHEEVGVQTPSTPSGGAMMNLMLGSPSSGGGSISTSVSPNEYASCHQGAHPGMTEELEKNLEDASNLLETETGLFHQRMWTSFQNCARAIAQVYVSNKQVPPMGVSPQPQQQHPTATQQSSDSTGSNSIGETSNLEQQCAESSSSGSKAVEDSFKFAAQHATTLYKDSLETSRRLIDLSIKTGSNRRTKEILAFVKSRKKRFIRRDELISFLIGGGGSSSCSTGKKETQQSAGGRKHHHQFNGLCPPGTLGNLFDGTYSFTGLVSSGNTHPQIYHMQQQQQQGQGFLNLMGSGGFSNQHPAQQAAQQPPALSSPLQPTANPQTLYPQQQSLQTSNNPIPSQQPFSSFSSSSNPTNPFASSLAATTPFQQSQRPSNNQSTPITPSHDDEHLHLAVQQLFVASSGNNSVAEPQPAHHEYTHIAGVKRPASNSVSVHEPHQSADEDDVSESSDRLRRTDCHLPGGEEEDDNMMEDSVDGGDASSFSNFKRMRFY